MSFNPTLAKDAHAPTRSWWAERKPDGTPYTREEWNAEWERQVKERMLLSNPPIPTAKDGPTSIIEARRQRVPSTL